MGAARGIDDDGPSAPPGETKTALAESGIKGGAGIGVEPCSKSRGTDVRDRNAYSLGLRSLPRCLRRHRATTLVEARCLHRRGDVIAPVLPEGQDDGPVMLALRPWETTFEFRDARNLLTSRILVRQIGDAAGGLHQAVNDVEMTAAVLDVLDSAPRDVGESELPLVGRNEGLHDRVNVRPYRRVDMDVVHGPVCPPTAGRDDEFLNLIAQPFGEEMARIQDTHPLSSAPRQKVTGQCWPPRTSGRARQHLKHSVG